METARISLINAVDREREKRQMSDRKFSIQVLGITPAYWCLLKAGNRPPTLNFLTILMQKLPEITSEVTAFIIAQGKDGGKEK